MQSQLAKKGGYPGPPTPSTTEERAVWGPEAYLGRGAVFFERLSPEVTGDGLLLSLIYAGALPILVVS